MYSRDSMFDSNIKLGGRLCEFVVCFKCCGGEFFKLLLKITTNLLQLKGENNTFEDNFDRQKQCFVFEGKIQPHLPNILFYCSLIFLACERLRSTRITFLYMCAHQMSSWMWWRRTIHKNVAHSKIDLLKKRKI